jgi:hypothetical protein
VRSYGLNKQINKNFNGVVASVITQFISALFLLAETDTAFITRKHSQVNGATVIHSWFRGISMIGLGQITF